MKPSAQWENNIIMKFIELRDKWEENKKHLSSLEKKLLPPVSDKSQWKSFCLGKNYTLPTPNIIMNLDSVSIEKVIIRDLVS